MKKLESLTVPEISIEEGEELFQAAFDAAAEIPYSAAVIPAMHSIAWGLHLGSAELVQSAMYAIGGDAVSRGLFSKDFRILNDLDSGLEEDAWRYAALFYAALALWKGNRESDREELKKVLSDLENIKKFNAKYSKK